MTIQMKLNLTQRLTLAQRLETRHALRLELLQTLHGAHGKPDATCPKCHHRLTTIEILRGFGDSPNDFTTRCPLESCAIRFEARLHCYIGTSGLSRVEMLFYCPSQTTHRLTPELSRLSPDEFRIQAPSLYFSALTHFGTLKRAFEEVRLVYTYLEIRDWKNKVISFLGQLPDPVIAECVGVSTARVRSLRRKHGIAPYDQHYHN